MRLVEAHSRRRKPLLRDAGDSGPRVRRSGSRRGAAARRRRRGRRVDARGGARDHDELAEQDIVRHLRAVLARVGGVRAGRPRDGARAARPQQRGRARVRAAHHAGARPRHLARIQLARGEVEGACAGGGGPRDRGRDQRRWGIAFAVDVAAMSRSGPATRGRGHCSPASRAPRAGRASRSRGSRRRSGRGSSELREVLGGRYAQLESEGRKLTTAQVVGIALSEAARHTTGAPRPRRRSARGGRRDRADRGSGSWRSARCRCSWTAARRVDGVGLGAPARAARLSIDAPRGAHEGAGGLEFWPDASAAQLRNNFHVTLHRLRKALGGPSG